MYTGWVTNTAPLRCFDVMSNDVFPKVILQKSQESFVPLEYHEYRMYQRSHQRNFISSLQINMKYFLNSK